MSATDATDAGARSLVVGYDRTESAGAAVAWAAREVSAGGKLVLVHSCRGLHAPPSPLASSDQRRALGRALIDELMLESEGSLFEIAVEAVVSEHDPVTALIDAARTYGARMIVVGYEQHSPLRKAFGTVSSELMGRSPVPVTVVGPLVAPPKPRSSRARGAQAGSRA